MKCEVIGIGFDGEIRIMKEYNLKEGFEISDEQNKITKRLIGNMDAKIWAEEFVKLVKIKPTIATDEGTMIGWFANAIMAGKDAGDGEYQDDLSPCQSRRSAIEDIKSYLKRKEEINVGYEHSKPLRIEMYELNAKIEYIKEKFNITEDDLK